MCVIECFEHVPGTSLNSVDGLELIITLGWVGAIISFPEKEPKPLEIKYLAQTRVLLSKLEYDRGGT